MALAEAGLTPLQTGVQSHHSPNYPYLRAIELAQTSDRVDARTQ
ncbi:MAG: hypothetical protein ACO3Z6_12545 [Pseudomonadales bacterium]